MMGTSKYKLNNEVFTGERGFLDPDLGKEEMQQCCSNRFRILYLKIPSHKTVYVMVLAKQTKLFPLQWVFVSFL